MRARAQYIHDLFTAAKSSISVNGMDIGEIEKASGTNRAHEGTTLSTVDHEKARN